jgi:hypothetical protein
MNIFDEIVQKNQPANYGDKWDIFNLLKLAVRNGENSIILEKHVDNVQKQKTRNDFIN